MQMRHPGSDPADTLSVTAAIVNPSAARTWLSEKRQDMSEIGTSPRVGA
jgi:hypothetical protein